MAKLNSDDRTKIVIAIISAIAVILAAVIGAAWSDIRSWFSQGNDLAKLGGVWRGDFAVTGGDAIDMTLTLGGNCKLEKVCGTFKIDIPNAIPCTADVTILSIEKDRYVFVASNKSDSCAAEVDYQYFEILDNNTLIYEVGAGTVVGRGVLKKVP